MSTPGRASKKTTSASKSAAKPKQAAAAAKKSPLKKIVKAVAKKAAVKKTAPSQSAAATSASTAKKAVKKAAKKATTVAQKVAKKVAKIISKVVAQKKAAAKPAAKPVAKPAVKPASKTAVAAGPRRASPKATPAKKTPAPRRPKAFPTRDAQHAYGFPPEVPELPESYGEDRLVLMTKDPEYLFAYWEVTPERLAAGEKTKRRGEEYREALRLNWAARDIFERNFAVLPITLTSRKWYVRVPFSGLSYQVEIGWLGESGHFVSLLASNPSDSPESWNATRRRLKHATEAGGVLGRSLAAARPQGSSDLTPPAPHPEAGEVPPITWNFPGPGSQSSSFGSGSVAPKPAPRPKAS